MVIRRGVKQIDGEPQIIILTFKSLCLIVVDGQTRNQKKNYGPRKINLVGIVEFKVTWIKNLEIKKTKR